jgi:hypothetical protein
MDEKAALAELIRVLELDETATWPDVVAYAAKAKGTARMANDTVARRTRHIEIALDVPPGAIPWPGLVRAVARQARLVAPADQEGAA